MRIRLKRLGEPRDLYADSGIAPDTFVHVQNQETRHSIWIHAGDAVPDPSPALNGYFELHPGEWKAFKGATLSAYSEQFNADIVIDDASGMLICGVSAASSNGMSTAQPIILPIVTGSMSYGADYLLRVSIDPATSGVPSYTEYCAVITLLHPDQQGRTITVKGSSLGLAPDSVIDSSGFPTINGLVNGSLGGFTINSALASMYGEVELKLCVTDSASSIGIYEVAGNFIIPNVDTSTFTTNILKFTA